MFYKKLSPQARLRAKLFNRSVFRPIVRIAAGIHTGNGLAHGVPASPDSASRRTHAF
ncbi:hypothetical protein MPRF_23240 [Mycolicibacterium parafortuitum]|uniref:Uncharacterized protein n=1 Tax=Mycolicibacterium parafortuitum TaxID=39692 RepID=A0A7I7U358_MYCPF|nr:hypothetical protein [Mycolicibacterium parafortuitum]BBY75425.1 hypothetical protein MPRF_23240 [Mycolicibacterium parafortuitum]